MSTPAGWYDDGSGRRRWWDGTQWTEHFEPTAPAAPAAPVEPAPQTPAFVAPAGAQTTALPPYATGAAVPDATAAYGATPYGTAGVAPFAGAPGPAPKKKPHVLAWVGLGASALGFILACIPGILIAGWILLPIGLILSIVAFFFPGAKWPAITGVILAVVGAIVGAIVFFALLVATAQDAYEDFEDSITQPVSPDDDADGDSDSGSAPLEKGALGEPVTINQYSATAQVTIESATWGPDNGTEYSLATNGGYLFIDVVWEGVEGSSSANPLYFSVKDANGGEGDLDVFADEMLSAGSVGPGEEITGMISFDVSDAGPYTVVITNEMMQPVAEITVEASAR